MVRRTHRAFRRVGSRRKFIWARSTEATVSGTGTSVDLLADFRTNLGITAGPIGITVVRVRGAFQVAYDTAATFTASTGVMVGLVVASRNLAAANVPKAGTGPNEDWMWHQWYPIGLGLDKGATDDDTIMGYMLDIKAMRKIQEADQTLWFSIDSPDAVAFTSHHRLSVGIKLP